jgi:hypothetical protein
MRLPLIEALTLAMCLGPAVRIKGQPPVVPEPLAWQASIGPFTGNFGTLVEAESRTLFASANALLYRSTDDGVTWTRCESQPAQGLGSGPADGWVLSVGRRLYSSGNFGGPMYVSDDECVSSRSIEPPAGSRWQRATVAVANGLLLYGFESHSVFTLFASDDDGRTWSQLAVPSGIQPRLASRGGTIFLVLSQRLYRSTDRESRGPNWRQTAHNSTMSCRRTGASTPRRPAGSGAQWTAEARGPRYSRQHSLRYRREG